MAFTCGFFNSENGDRKYNAEQMSAIFDGIIADGVFTTIGDHLAVSAGTGMQVLVGTGKAWFDHTWNVNDAAYPLAIAASDVTLSRIDAIVLETNHSDSVRLNKLRVVQGAVASSPAKPTLTNSEKVHQHPLAWVTVKPGVTQIAASAIENAVGTSACPFVTGIIATTSIDDLFNQWNGEFDEWFDNLKAQLSDNVVANLQRQIDQKVAKIDVATIADIKAGTSTTKWVTPKVLNDANIVPKVGDIEHTFRTDLGNDWALCNGDNYSPSEYPTLYSMAPSIFGGKDWSYLQATTGDLSGGYALAGNENLAVVMYGRIGHQQIFIYDIKNRNFIKSVALSSSDGSYCYPQDLYLSDDNTLIAVGQESYGQGGRIFEIPNVLAAGPTIVKKTSAEVNDGNTAYARIGYNKLTGQYAAVLNKNGKLGMAFRDSQGNWTTVLNLASITSDMKSYANVDIKSDGTNWVVVVGDHLFLISPSGALLSTTAMLGNSSGNISYPHIIIDNNEKHVICVLGFTTCLDFKFTSWGATPVRTTAYIGASPVVIHSADKIGNEYILLGYSGGSAITEIRRSTDFSSWTLLPAASYYAADGTYQHVSLQARCIIVKNYMVIGIAGPSTPNIIINCPQLPAQPYDKNGYNYIKVK